MKRSLPGAMLLLAVLSIALPAHAKKKTKALDDAPFCKADDLEMSPWDHDWCPLVGDENELCPSLPEACEHGAVRQPPSGNECTGRMRVRWGDEGVGSGERRGQGHGRGNKRGTGDGDGQGRGKGDGKGYQREGDGDGAVRHGRGNKRGDGDGTGQGPGQGDGEGHQREGGGGVDHGRGNKRGHGDADGQGPGQGDGRGHQRAGGDDDGGESRPDDPQADQEPAPTPPPEPEMDEPEEPPDPPDEDEPFELPESMSMFAKFMFFALVAAAVIWLVWVIWKNRVKGRDEDEDELAPATVPVSPSGDPATPRQVETDVERLMRLARDAAARGEYEDGIEHAYAAVLRRLEGDGLIDMHTSQTNGDYVRGVRDKPSVAAPLRDIVRDVERVQFGSAAPDATLFERFLAKVVPLVSRTSALLLVLFATGWVSGCDQQLAANLPVAGDEGPGGLSNVLALLREKDVEAGYRVTPLDQISDRTRVLVVLPGGEEAFEKAADDVYDWVEDGGTLVLAGAFPDDDLIHIEPVITRYTHPDLRAVNDLSWMGGLDIKAPAGPTIESYGAEFYGLPALIRDNRDVYAVSGGHGGGRIIALADDRLISNIAIAFGDNAEFITGLLDRGGKVELCTELTGAGAQNPLETVNNARLTPLIAQLLVLLLLFLLWRGIAFGRLRDREAQTRRSYADHVKALGTQYARAEASGHALGAYARWALERLRERVPRGKHRDLDELAEEIAGRTGRSIDYVRVVLNQAQAATETFGPTSVRAESLRGATLAAAPGPDHHMQLMQQLTDLLAALGRGQRSP